MPNRREFLKVAACCAATTVTEAVLQAGPSSVPFAGTCLKGPLLNHDSTEFFATYSADEMSGTLVDAWVDSLASAGVGGMMSCINAMRTNYDSAVWECDWQGYDPEGPDNQAILKYIPQKDLPITRKRLNSAKKLSDLGIDFHRRALARCRQLGIAGWISIRMNDLHDCDLPDSPLLSTFYKEHRHWARVPYRSTWRDRALDWEHEEVREHYMKLIREALNRYDLDGLELDWMRFGYFFRIGRELEGGRILTQFLARVCQEVQKAAKRLRHPVQLGVRIPSTPETARQLGLDGVAWARSDLIDLLVVTPFWVTSEFNMPMVTWKRLLAGTNVLLAGGMEILCQPSPASKQSTMTPELAVGAATAILAGGADFVYLFNYFPESTPWGHRKFNSTLQAMKSLESLHPLPRRHTVTYRDVLAPGEPADFALPALAKEAIFRLQTGPKPVGRKVEVWLELELSKDAALLPPSIRVNGTSCPAPIQQGANIYIYPVPEEALAEEVHVIETWAGDGKTIKIMRVEFVIGPQQA